MIGTPARPNKALMVKAMEIPTRSESQPTNTTTAAELSNEDKTKILGGNAQRLLFGTEGGEIATGP